jgi:alkylhydroperoxidase family enzyme
MDSHAYFLRAQGATDENMISVLEGRLDNGGLTPAERLLMDYVRLITDESHKSTPEDVQKLRDAGWGENQIAEAVYITAMFAFFNRVADSFGIPPQNYLVLGKMTP